MKIKHVPGVYGPPSGHSQVVFEVVDTPVLDSKEKIFMFKLLKWNEISWDFLCFGFIQEKNLYDYSKAGNEL